MNYKPNELLTESGVPISTTDELQFAIRQGVTIVRAVPSLAFRIDRSNLGLLEVVHVGYRDEIGEEF